MNLAVSLVCAPLLLASVLFAVFRDELPPWAFWTVLAAAGGGSLGGAMVLVVALIVSEFGDVRNE